MVVKKKVINLEVVFFSVYAGEPSEFQKLQNMRLG